MPPIPVEVVTIMKDRLTGTTKKINQTIQQMRGGVEQSTTQMKKFSKGTVVASQSITKTTRGLKRFQFEWLGVMFLGMAINKLFGKYIQQALEMLGITELFTEALKYMIFMALEPLLPIMYSLLGWFFDLPVPMQRAIGWLIIFLGVGGLLLMMFGQMMLGILSLKLVMAGLPIAGLIAKFGILGGIIKVIGGFFIGLGGIIMGVVAAIIAIIVGMRIAWIENFLGMKNTVRWFVEGVNKYFKGMINFIGGILKFFVALFTGDFEKMKDTIVQIFKGLVNMFLGWFKAIGSGIIAIFTGLFDWIWANIRMQFAFIKWIIDKIKGLVSPKGILGGGGKDIFGDFIWRPGSPPIEVSPRDTIIGFKGPGPAGASINFAPTYNINVADKGEFEDLIKQNNVRLVEDLRRMVQD